MMTLGILAPLSAKDESYNAYSSFGKIDTTKYTFIVVGDT